MHKLGYLWLTGVLLFSAVVQGRDVEDLRIAAARSTLTVLSLTTATTTAPFTCAIAVSIDNICRKRRKRNTKQFIADVLENDATDLDSSSSTGEEDPSSRDPRLSVTVWTTVYSSYTYTSTSTNNAQTFSVSFFCTFPGQMFPPNCVG